MICLYVAPGSFQQQTPVRFGSLTEDSIIRELGQAPAVDEDESDPRSGIYGKDCTRLAFINDNISHIAHWQVLYMSSISRKAQTAVGAQSKYQGWIDLG